MSNRFSSGKYAIAECDVCGFRYPLNSLRRNVVKGYPQNILACVECNDPDHPQLMLGSFPVEDPQAIENPRPDQTYYSQGNSGAGGSRMTNWNWNPVGGGMLYDASLTPNPLVTTTAMGTVTILTL